MRRPIHHLVVLFAVALLAAACSGGSGKASTTTAPAGDVATTIAAATTTAPPETTTTESGMIDGLENVRDAVVRIVAEGSFVDPAEGLVYNAAGSGSGFIVDPSGLAVTNNHVVTGAAFLQVYVEGEDEPRNAKVLGVSECSDLAVIDIDGSDFPYLEWYDGDVSTGTKVYAAGFPLGDPEFTLTEGIISKEKANGESPWASVGAVVEHTAQILHGNSGGPLVTEDGRVLGINYAGNEELHLNYAIGRAEVDKVISDLTGGENVASIGLNGQAIVGDDISGIWVSSVASGSPAAKLGITGGDVITKMEGIILAIDGSMADYCNILRSHIGDDPLSVEVLRFDTQEVLKGTLNGDEPLQVAFSFADELEDDVAATADATYEYTTVHDDAGLLTMEIPTTWTDIDGEGWYRDDELGGNKLVGNAILASPDLAAYLEGWGTPGVFFGASEVLLDQVGSEGLLNDQSFSESCTYDGRTDYDDGTYKGRYDLWLNCGNTDTAFVSLEAYPADRSFVIMVQIQIVNDADLDAFDHIIQSFYVDLG